MNWEFRIYAHDLQLVDIKTDFTNTDPIVGLYCYLFQLSPYAECFCLEKLVLKFEVCKPVKIYTANQLL